MTRFGCKELVLENKKRTRKGRDTRGEVLNEAEFFEEREKTFGGVPKTRFSLSLLKKKKTDVRLRERPSLQRECCCFDDVDAAVYNLNRSPSSSLVALCLSRFGRGKEHAFP